MSSHLDCFLHLEAFVKAGIIHHNHTTRWQLGKLILNYPLREDCCVNRGMKQTQCVKDSHEQRAPITLVCVSWLPNHAIHSNALLLAHTYKCGACHEKTQIHQDKR